MCAQVGEEPDFAGLTRELFEAVSRQDTESLESLVAGGFRTTGGVPGNRMSRDEWMGLVAGAFALQSFELREFVSTRDADTAVVSYGYSQAATYQDLEAPAEWFISDVWVRREGGWKLLGRHYEVLRGEDAK